VSPGFRPRPFDPIFSGMKFHLQAPTLNIVTGTGPGWVRVGATEYRDNLVLLPDAVAPGWAPRGLAGLDEADFAALLAYAPEMVIVGTGDRQRFLHPRLTQALTAARVGVDMMDTRAACRPARPSAWRGAGPRAKRALRCARAQAWGWPSSRNTPR